MSKTAEHPAACVPRAAPLDLGADRLGPPVERPGSRADRVGPHVDRRDPHVDRGGPRAERPAARGIARTGSILLPQPKRVHPGLRPYPSLRFAAEVDLREKGRHLARALALRLRIYRVEQSLTREALAELTGVSASAIKRVERSGAICLERFLRLALQLGLEDDVAELFPFRRHGVPSLVLASRATQRKNGRRDRRQRACERAVAGARKSL